MASTVRYNMPGAIDEPMQTNSGLDLLPTNNTLIVMPFKGKDGPRQPEEIPAEFSKSTAAVMEYIQPNVKVNIDTGDSNNPEATDTISFQGGVESFSPTSIKKNSSWLRRFEDEYSASSAMIDRIDKNAQFRKALDDQNAKAAILATLRSILAEVEESLKVDHED